MTIISPDTPTKSAIKSTVTTRKKSKTAPKKQISNNNGMSAKNLGQIRVTRNISAIRVETRNEPMDFPESGVLYMFHTDDWANKMSFYDKVAYSFGIPSTQKPVHCSFLNTRVMHYERTCQGVYYCKHHHENNGECTVKPARYRFHACSIHKQSLQKSEHKCPVKLHFYVPVDTNDHRRLLLCLNEHNHALLKPSQLASPISSPESPVNSAFSPNCASRTPSPLSTCSSSSGSPTLLSPVSPTEETINYYHPKSENEGHRAVGSKRCYDHMTNGWEREEAKRVKLTHSPFNSLQFLNLSAITNNFKPEMLSCSYESDVKTRPILPSISTLGLDFRF
jgi:hypothetical protein